jgi:hypothetical protein
VGYRSVGYRMFCAVCRDSLLCALLCGSGSNIDKVDV